MGATSGLYARQLENEREQIEGGVERYRKGLERLRRRGEFGASMPGQWLIETCFPALVKRFEEEIDRALSGVAGRRGSAMGYLVLLPADTLTFLTLRTVIDCVMLRKTEKTRIAQRIGAAVQEELHHLAMRADKKKSKAYQYWTARADQASHPYTKSRCIDKLKSLYDPRIFLEIGSKERTDIGVTCLQFASESTEALVEYQDVYKGKVAWYIGISEQFQSDIDGINEKLETLWPINDPMLVPPKPWEGAFRGGYIGAVGNRTKLVRTPKRRYLEDLQLNRDKLDTVFKALNAIQSTPWRINRNVYQVMVEAKGLGGNAYGLPEPNDRPLPKPPPDMEGNEQARQQYAFAIQEVRDFNRTNGGHRVALGFMLATAKKYLDDKAVYFPHNLDWRGRIYPIASYISPQGSDYSRALLEFSVGKPLGTNEAAGWLAVHGANCFGEDKVPFEERIAWVRGHEAAIRATVANPLDYRWWVEEADSPWMFLAWCYEWVGYLDNGLDHISHIAIAMDGSCNGLQNFAAMLRHPETARSVNLAPSDRPNDIYRQVAEIVAARVHTLAEARPESADELHEIVKTRTGQEINAGKKGDSTRRETGELWNVLAAKWIDGQISRSLVKRPVMTYPYAVSIFGVKQQLTATLKEMHRAGGLDFPYEHASKIAFMLKEIVYRTVREEVWAAARAMDWLKHAAQVVSNFNKPISWMSPAGLPIIQEYKKTKGTRINTVVGKQRIQQSLVVEQDAIDPRSQASAIAPNFVHSCDASHLMLTVNACLDAGVTDFHMIHDSYGTHACNTTLLAKTLREQFVRIYSGNVLADFRQTLLNSLPEEAAGLLTDPPEQGDFDLEEVLGSRYFFI